MEEVFFFFLLPLSLLSPSLHLVRQIISRNCLVLSCFSGLSPLQHCNPVVARDLCAVTLLKKKKTCLLLYFCVITILPDVSTGSCLNSEVVWINCCAGSRLGETLATGTKIKKKKHPPPPAAFPLPLRGSSAVCAMVSKVAKRESRPLFYAIFFFLFRGREKMEAFYSFREKNPHLLILQNHCAVMLSLRL